MKAEDVVAVNEAGMAFRVDDLTQQNLRILKRLVPSHAARQNDPNTERRPDKQSDEDVAPERASTRIFLQTQRSLATG